MADTEIPPGLRTDAPPEDGSQIIAWATDQHGLGYGQPSDDPRWCVVQFAGDYPGAAPYWRWCVPGMSTRVVVLAWLPLPALDIWGKHALRARDA